MFSINRESCVLREMLTMILMMMRMGTDSDDEYYDNASGDAGD